MEKIMGDLMHQFWTLISCTYLILFFVPGKKKFKILIVIYLSKTVSIFRLSPISNFFILNPRQEWWNINLP